MLLFHIEIFRYLLSHSTHDADDDNKAALLLLAGSKASLLIISSLLIFMNILLLATVLECEVLNQLSDDMQLM